MVGVYTQPDRPSGRGKKTRKSPVKVLAEARGLLVFQPETLSTQDARAEMESLKPDVAVVAAYGLIPSEGGRWTLPTYGVLNVHPSLLPRHRGPAPVANAILEGDEKTGVTVMKVEPKVDSGPILRSVSVEIGPRDTTRALSQRTGGDRGATLGGNAEGLGSGLDRAKRAGRSAWPRTAGRRLGGTGRSTGICPQWR